MALTTVPQTVQKELDDANPGTGWDMLRLMKLGTMLTPTKFDSGSITASATVTLPSAALLVATCRVVAGTATGPRQITDAGGTATTGVALISDDGLTLTFEATVTQIIVEYLPRAAVPMSTLEQPAS